MTTAGDGNLCFAMYEKERDQEEPEEEDIHLEEDEPHVGNESKRDSAMMMMEAGLSQMSTPEREADMAQQVKVEEFIYRILRNKRTPLISAPPFFL